MRKECTGFWSVEINSIIEASIGNFSRSLFMELFFKFPYLLDSGSEKGQVDINEVITVLYISNISVTPPT